MAALGSRNGEAAKQCYANQPSSSGYQRAGRVSIAFSVYPVSESLLHVGPWLPMLSLTVLILGSRMRANISSALSDYIGVR